jgi:hypothetical protein
MAPRYKGAGQVMLAGVTRAEVAVADYLAGQRRVRVEPVPGLGRLEADGGVV